MAMCTSRCLARGFDQHNDNDRFLEPRGPEFSKALRNCGYLSENSVECEKVVPEWRMPNLRPGSRDSEQRFQTRIPHSSESVIADF